MSAPLHPRTELLQAALACLQERVSGVQKWNLNRYRPLWQNEELPAVSVYGTTERAEIENTAPRRLKRFLQVEVEVVAAMNAKLEETIDSLALQIEQAIAVDETLKGTAGDCYLTGTEIVERIDGNKPQAAAILVFEAVYRTWAPDEQVLRNFEGGDFTLKPSGSADEDAIEGKFDVEEEEEE